ncbi:MAG: STAS domain-containing protein, partial [Synechococcus sp.]|nr:STAS domain-containing protein [Synechococcus sp.]
MSDPQLVLTPSGILNGESGKQLEATVRSSLEGTQGPLLLDCSELSFMDSSGFGHLVVSHKLARQQERELLLCGLNNGGVPPSGVNPEEQHRRSRCWRLSPQRPCGGMGGPVCDSGRST